MVPALHELPSPVTHPSICLPDCLDVPGCVCACMLLQDDFYLRHLIKNNLLDPVMDAFFANGDRYNLLNSAVLEMVEFIRKENLKVRGLYRGGGSGGAGRLTWRPVVVVSVTTWFACSGPLVCLQRPLCSHVGRVGLRFACVEQRAEGVPLPHCACVSCLICCRCRCRSC